MTEFIGKDFNKETEDAIYFFTPKNYAFDNFSAYVVDIWDKRFLTSEHAYQWKKYSTSHPDLAQKIFDCTSPNQTKKIADANKDTVPSSFNTEKVFIMEEILRAKVDQHEKVKKTLIESGSKEIIENSPNDEFWGIGAEGNGQNMLGKIWMKIRKDFV